MASSDLEQNATHPKIASEWHPTKNTIGPDQIRVGSHIKAWWLGKCGHSWESEPRTRVRSGCPFCIPTKGEKAVRSALTLLSIPFKEQVRFADCRYKRPLPFDFQIFSGDKFGLIEYQGLQHYKSLNPDTSIFESQKVRDQIKKVFCQSNNIPFIEIPCWSIDDIQTIIEKFRDNI